MDIKPIKTDADYQAALKDIENLMMAEFDSQQGEKLNVLVTSASLRSKTLSNRFTRPKHIN